MTLSFTKPAAYILILLGLSLSLNLFLVGFYVGGRLHADTKPPASKVKKHRQYNEMSPPISVGRMLRAVPEEKRAVVKQSLDKRRVLVRETLMDQRQAQKKLYELLSADELDLPALKTALDQEMVYKQKLEGFSRDLILDVVVTLDKQARQKFAKSLLREKVRKFRQPHKDGNDPEGRRPPPPRDGD